MAVVFCRTIMLYLITVVVLRLMGKRQISQMQPFELVVALMIADLVSVPMEDVGVPLISGILPVLGLLVVHNLLGFLTMKSQTIRKIMCGQPSILIENGKVNEKELKKLNVHIVDVMENLRSQGVDSVEQVMYCLIETNGAISVLLKGKDRPATAQEENIKADDPALAYTVIFDGKFDTYGMEKLCINESMIESNITRLTGVQSAKDVFLCMIDSGDRMFLQKKNDDRTFCAAFYRGEAA